MTKKTSGGRIENDEQYERSLKWMVDKSLELEQDSSLKGESRAKLLRTYDYVSDQVEQYRIRTYLEACPSNRQSYIKMKLIEED